MCFPSSLMCRRSVLVMIDELILMRIPVEPVQNTIARRLNSSHMRSQENAQFKLKVVTNFRDRLVKRAPDYKHICLFAKTFKRSFIF